MRAQPHTVMHVSSVFLLVCVLLLPAGGCVKRAPVAEQEAVNMAVVTLETLDVNAAYARGLDAFWRGEYVLAAALFESVARKMDDQAYRSKALYGLACSRLAGASDAQDVKTALETWLEWEKTVMSQEGQIDPRMLTPFVRNVNVKLNAQAARDNREARSQSQAAARPAVSDQDLARRLQEKEKEVLHLQKQIKALETIHREIQEKKKMSAQ